MYLLRTIANTVHTELGKLEELVCAAGGWYTREDSMNHSDEIRGLIDALEMSRTALVLTGHPMADDVAGALKSGDLAALRASAGRMPLRAFARCRLTRQAGAGYGSGKGR